MWPSEEGPTGPRTTTAATSGRRSSNKEPAAFPLRTTGRVNHPPRTTAATRDGPRFEDAQHCSDHTDNDGNRCHRDPERHDDPENFDGAARGKVPRRSDPSPNGSGDEGFSIQPGRDPHPRPPRNVGPRPVAVVWSVRPLGSPSPCVRCRSSSCQSSTRPGTLASALHRCETRTIPEIVEILIADGGSTDDTSPILLRCSLTWNSAPVVVENPDRAIARSQPIDRPSAIIAPAYAHHLCQRLRDTMCRCPRAHRCRSGRRVDASGKAPQRGKQHRRRDDLVTCGGPAWLSPCGSGGRCRHRVPGSLSHRHAAGPPRFGICRREE